MRLAERHVQRIDIRRVDADPRLILVCSGREGWLLASSKRVSLGRVVMCSAELLLALTRTRTRPGQTTDRWSQRPLFHLWSVSEYTVW